MKMTAVSKEILARRREDRDMRADGWERVAEGGGPLWEIARGPFGHIITDVRIAADGISLWVKIVKRRARGRDLTQAEQVENLRRALARICRECGDEVEPKARCACGAVND